MDDYFKKKKKIFIFLLAVWFAFCQHRPKQQLLCCQLFVQSNHSEEQVLHFDQWRWMASEKVRYSYRPFYASISLSLFGVIVIFLSVVAGLLLIQVGSRRASLIRLLKGRLEQLLWFTAVEVSVWCRWVICFTCGTQ